MVDGLAHYAEKVGDTQQNHTKARVYRQECHQELIYDL